MALAETVELVSNDGSITLSGELLDFDGNFYTIETKVGQLVIDATQVQCNGSACIREPEPVAQDNRIELISLDSNVNLSGELLDFDGTSYIIGTILGNLTVDALQVRCLGASCPEIVAKSAFVRLSGDPTVISDLIPMMLAEFGDSIEGDSLLTISNGEPDVVSVLDGAGEKVLDMAMMTSQATPSLDNLLAGQADIAILTRPANTAERSAFLAAGLGDLTSPEQQIIFGLDGIVVLTSESNPTRALSKQVLARIFSGDITNWSQIGGPDAQINLFVRAQDTGTGALFNANIMEPENRGFSSRSTIVATDQEMAILVAADPLAIGFSGLSSAGNAKILDIRDTCGIQIPATSFTIKTEEYPLTKRLYVYSTNERKAPQLRRFLDFLSADAAQNAIARSGLIDLGVSYQSNNEQGLRYLAAIIQTDAESSLREIREMTSSFLASDRLSLTLRFALGSSQLDDRATDDIQRLVRYIATHDLENKELLLVGFTDNIGNARANVVLSQQRANSALESLLAALPEGGSDSLPIISTGFGELSPLSCNDSPNGRRINRRVELWLRDTVSITN